MATRYFLDEDVVLRSRPGVAVLDLWYYSHKVWTPYERPGNVEHLQPISRDEAERRIRGWGATPSEARQAVKG